MGWTYNTTDPNAATNAPTIAAIGITFTTVSLLVVCLRIYVRGWIVKALGIDDWTIVVTWFTALGFMIVTLLQTKWGLGLQHLADMPTQNIFNFGLLQYCGAPFYILSILGFKLSLLFSFLRIAVEQRHRAGIIMIIVACTAFHLSFLLVQINLCNPIAKQWDPKITTGSCLVAVPFYTSMASITIIFDVLIMLTPFPMLIKSHLPTRKKIFLLGIFSLGTFITAIQLIRILTIKSLANYIDSSALIMWSMVENNLGIIVASTPTLTPLIRIAREKRSSSGSRGKKDGTGNTYPLQSMKVSRKGLMVLGRGTDNRQGSDDGEFKNTTAVGSRKTDDSSEDLIEGTQIHRKTEVTISREER
ncbi:hypothetical protein BGZ60DRAFT_568081 [Tricladium varicosporioides]|nr:hypothetical protein BGZ60DRAFT_568081 [Hymenoscyphus varicosporioides]